MSNYSSLKATVNANIRANGNQEITGTVLNSVLTQMINSLGAGYQYMGVMTPQSTPGTPDQNVFYLGAPGEYDNFGGLVVHEGFIGVFKYNGSWATDTVMVSIPGKMGIDDFEVICHNAGATTPVANGKRLSAIRYVESGDYLKAQTDFGAGVTVAVYDSFTHALLDTNKLQIISDPFTHSEIIAQITSSGYLQIRWKKEDGTAFTEEERQDALSNSDISIYHGVGVDEFFSSGRITALEDRMGDPFPAHSLPTTGAAVGAYINISDNVWKSSSQSNSYMLAIKPGKKYHVRAPGAFPTRIAILSDNDVTLNTKPHYAEGYDASVYIEATEGYTFVSPRNGYYLSVGLTASGDNIRPSYILEEMTAEELSAYMADNVKTRQGQGSRFVDARADSPTFGMSLKASSADWTAGHPIFVRGFVKIRIFNVVASSSATYGGIAGSVFYDKDFNPITDGAFTIALTNTAVSSTMDIDIPSNAYYWRTTFLTSINGKTFTLIRNTDDGVEQYTEPIYHPYFGEKIELDNSYYAEVLSNINDAYMQSAAVFGDYLFSVNSSLSKMVCMNLRSLKKLYVLSTGLTPGDNWHSNQASFGSKYYDEADPFPVLYISQQNNSEGRGEIQGYRIIPTYTDGEISSFTISLVQTILLPAVTDENCLANPNVAFDTQNGWMWAYSRNENPDAANFRKATFSRFAIPELTESVVTLNDSDILERFQDDWSMLYAQGGFIHNGKLVIMQGYPDAGFINCRVIDLYLDKRQVSLIDLFADGFTREPEGVFWYAGQICFTTSAAYIYRINI